MLTIKKQFGKKLFLFPLLAVLLAGCSPPGPRALLDGARLIDEGDYTAAIEKLKLATSLLNTNASAWNYLGIACQHAGKFAEAEQAYGKARAANRDLVETHYNLGCLWLDQNRPDLAKTEFLSFTSLRPGAAEGWLKLGTARTALARLERGRRQFQSSASFESAKCRSIERTRNDSTSAESSGRSRAILRSRLEAKSGLRPRAAQPGDRLATEQSFARAAEIS
jgi:tetratricopeptide (TPR) repeat protein